MTEGARVRCLLDLLSVRGELLQRGWLATTDLEFMKSLQVPLMKLGGRGNTSLPGCPVEPECHAALASAL